MPGMSIWSWRVMWDSWSRPYRSSTEEPFFSRWPKGSSSPLSSDFFWEPHPGPSLSPPGRSQLPTPSSPLGIPSPNQAVIFSLLAVPLPLCSQKQVLGHFRKGFTTDHLEKQLQEETNTSLESIIETWEWSVFLGSWPILGSYLFRQQQEALPTSFLRFLKTDVIKLSPEEVVWIQVHGGASRL